MPYNDNINACKLGHNTLDNTKLMCYNDGTLKLTGGRNGYQRSERRNFK